MRIKQPCLKNNQRKVLIKTDSTISHLLQLERDTLNAIIELVCVIEIVLGVLTNNFLIVN